MKILLVAPPYPLEEAPSPPLGICYVAAVCEAHNVEVELQDYIISKYSSSKLKKVIDAVQPQIFGITSVTLNVMKALEILKTAKQHRPQMITIMGGPHVSFDYKDILTNNHEVDLIVIGEAEQTLSELLPQIQDRKTWHNIAGLAFRDHDQVIVTPPRSLLNDLNQLPLPARHLLSYARYQALGFPVSIITSRGCPNQCIFCLGRRMVGFKVRRRSVTQVMDEIETLLSSGFSMINIADDLFTTSRKQVRAFCYEIKNRGLDFIWSAFARVDTVDAEILALMKSAGCHAVSFGIESGSEKILQCVKKGITIKQIRKAVAACKQTGIRAHASFIVGLPGESPSTLEASQKLIRELDIEYGFHYLAPFPGTTIRDNIDSYDLEILTNDWSRYDANAPVVKTAKLTPRAMQTFVEQTCRHITVEWEDLQKRFQEGHVLTAAENQKVESYYRLEFIFKLLSENLIEEYQFENQDNSLEKLSAYAVKQTNSKPALVAHILKNLADTGLLICKPGDGSLRWEWAS